MRFIALPFRLVHGDERIDFLGRSLPEAGLWPDRIPKRRSIPRASERNGPGKRRSPQRRVPVKAPPTNRKDRDIFRTRRTNYSRRDEDRRKGHRWPCDTAARPIARHAAGKQHPRPASNPDIWKADPNRRSEEHTFELQSLRHLVCRL